MEYRSLSISEFFDCVHSRISLYDLLKHPFYKAWTRGDLTREDLRVYAEQYYWHVKFFPWNVLRLARRLPDGALRDAVMANFADEIGENPESSHDSLWLKFVEGFGGSVVPHEKLSREMKDLLFFFDGISTYGTPENALTAFYVYESQIPRVAEEKLRGLKQIYEADESTCEYFKLHTIADVAHADVWRQQIRGRLAANPQAGREALVTADVAAKSLWNALTGIEQACLDRVSKPF